MLLTDKYSIESLISFRVCSICAQTVTLKNFTRAESLSSPTEHDGTGIVVSAVENTFTSHLLFYDTIFLLSCLCCSEKGCKNNHSYEKVE